MIIEDVGQIEDGFYALGHPSVPVYLMDGRFPALFDAGFTALANLYIQAIKGVLGERAPAFLFLTHAHWDHIGAAGIFKETWPEMKIVASEKTREIISKPSVVERVDSLNREALGALRDWGVALLHRGAFVPFMVDEILVPWKSYQVGENVTIQGFPSPGHTRDFVVYWIPERKILIASEAVGCDDVPEFLVDYDTYVRDIKRFMKMAPRVLCTGHQRVVTGEDVRHYLGNALQTAENYRCFVERYLEAGESVEEISERVKRMEWDRKTFPKQPLEPYIINTRQRVLTLKERWERRGVTNSKAKGLPSPR